MPQSKELTAFYRAYAAWVEAGAPNNGIFIRSNGLCSNAMCYDHTVSKEMRNQFAEAGFPIIQGWGYLPFNLGIEDYTHESDNAIAYLNEKRIKWVRDHLNG